jgi:hypothetical protein
VARCLLAGGEVVAALVGEGCREIDVAMARRRIGIWFFTVANCNDNKLLSLVSWISFS